nr:three component ABC system middle component [uncultured Carboxylicivirga sp.]
MKAKDVEVLIHNPFHLSRILHHFISGAISVNDNGVKTELIYLVLPLVLNQKVSDKLQALNKNSKLVSIIENHSIEVFISQLDNKTEHTKKKTKHGLIVLANTVQLNISDFISSEEVIDYKTEKDLLLKPIYKAAYILGILIAKERYLTVMNRLRITQL